MKLRLAFCVFSLLLFLGAFFSRAEATCSEICHPSECNRYCRSIGAASTRLAADPDLCDPIECDRSCVERGHLGGMCTVQRCVCVSEGP